MPQPVPPSRLRFALPQPRLAEAAAYVLNVNAAQRLTRHTDDGLGWLVGTSDRHARKAMHVGRGRTRTNADERDR
jgi:hypothetical protein